MPVGEGRTKNNIAGRVGSGVFVFFFLNWKDTTCIAPAYASCSVQGRHKRTVRENSQHAKPPRSSRCRLLAGDNDTMEGFQAPHKGEGEEKIFSLWRYCPETSSLVLSVPFPLQICRKSTSFTAFFEQWCSQLKSKLSFSSTATLLSSTRHAPWKPPGELWFPSHADVRLSTCRSLCRVSQYRWVDRASYLVLPTSGVSSYNFLRQ